MNRLQYLLFKLSEEANEIGQIASKAAQFGMDEIYSGDGNTATNWERTCKELDDLHGVLLAIGHEVDRHYNPNNHAQLEKVQKIMYYSRLAADERQLSDPYPEDWRPYLWHDAPGKSERVVLRFTKGTKDSVPIGQMATKGYLSKPATPGTV